MPKPCIEICGVSYLVEFVDDQYCGQNMGKSDFLNAKIFIRKNMPRQVQENVLLHEIMHICYRNGYLSKDDDEERVVEVLTNILYPVLMSNPFKVLNDESNK